MAVSASISGVKTIVLSVPDLHSIDIFPLFEERK